MEFLRLYQLEITLAVALFAFFEFLVILGVKARMTNLSRMLRTLLSGPGGADLEAMLLECQKQSAHAVQRTDEQEAYLAQLTKVSRASLQHFALLRYDAFDDVRGQQSFSLALLDAHRNGAVITSLFTRADNRCYGKPITSGVSQQELSSEEQHVLNIALGKTAPASANPQAAEVPTAEVPAEGTSETKTETDAPAQVDS